VAFHALDHHDGVVHHQADRQHQAEERQRIDGKTEHREEYECAYQRDGHGKKWNQRGAPALQKDIDHKDDQSQRDQQGDHNLLDAFGDGPRSVQGNDIVQVVWKALLHLRHQLVRRGRSLNRIRARNLIKRKAGAGLAIVAPGDAVVL